MRTEAAPGWGDPGLAPAARGRGVAWRTRGFYLLAGLSLLAPATARAQTAVYYSIGTSYPGDLKYGNPTVTLTAGTATFSSPQLDNIGVGDEVTYVGGPKVYVTARTSSTVYTVGTATGGVPPNIAGASVTSITRAFGTLLSAVNGSKDASHLNNADLVGPNRQLQWALYNDGPLNESQINIQGYTTGPANYIRLFTPVLPSQVGTSQRHQGRAGTGFRFRPVYIPVGSSEVIEVTSDHVRIEGVEMDVSQVTGIVATYYVVRVSASAASDVRLDKLILHDLTNAVSGAAQSDLACVNFGVANVALSNSLCYAVHNNNSHTSTDIYGFRTSASSTATLYLHNNTVYDIASLTLVAPGPGNVHGISKSASGPTEVVRNNVVLNVTQAAASAALSCFQTTYAAGSGNNVTSDATAQGAGSVFNQTSYASYFRSVVAGAEDLHLLNDSLSLWGANGADLDTDPNLPVVDDVDGEARDATAPDVGADEYVAPPFPRMRVKSGRYQGSGVAGRAVYVGFQPDVVFVKRLEGPYGAGNEAADNAVLKTNTMGANTKSLWRGGLALAANMVQSLDPAGFTVGSHAAVNEGPGVNCASGCTYYWVAFKAAPGFLKVGSYSGDGAALKSIGGFGFSPEYVIVLPPGAGDPAGTPVWAQSTLPFGEAYEFDARLRRPGAITGLESDGFQVGQGNAVSPYQAPDLNVNGATYHYVAWNAVHGYTAVGRYAGNGADNQYKSQVGFFPEWVLIKKDDIDTSVPGEKAVTHKTASTGVNTDVGGLRFSELAVAPDTLQRLLPLGFEIGADSRVNSAGDATCRNGPPCSYHFVAFGPHEPQVNYRSIGTAANYTAGTITVVGGSDVVNGSGTTWLASNRGRGDRILINGVNYVVLGVASDTQLRLTIPYTGANATYSGALGEYLIARQFASPAAWENCVDGGAGTCAPFPDNTASLVTDDRSEVGIAYKEGNPSWMAGVNTTLFTINGSTTDATHTITLTADGINRHYGISDAGVVFRSNPSSTDCDILDISDPYTTIEWIEFAGDGSGTNNIDGPTVVSGIEPGLVVIRNNIFRNFGSSGMEIQGLSGTVDVYNNFFYGASTRPGQAIQIDPGETVNVLNNTISFTASGARGVMGTGASHPDVVMRNNLVVSTGASAYAVPGFNAASGTNISNDLTAPGAGSFTNVCVSGAGCVNLVSATDLHLQGTSFAIDKGANLSGTFVTDIDAGARSGSWDIGADEFGTTAVTLMSFRAGGVASGIELTWRTASELANLGFHLHRATSEAGPYERITPSLIPGLGSSPVGAAYDYRDTGLVAGQRYYYRLEDIDTASLSTFHGPVSAVAGLAAEPPPAGGDDEPAQGSFESCPGWVLSISGASPDELPRCTRQGDPGAVSLELVASDTRSATLELRTGGFWVLHDRSGAVRVFVPGFDFPPDGQALALPFRRALVDATVGRRVQLGGVRALELARFPGLLPGALGPAEMELRSDGTVRPTRRLARRATATSTAGRTRSELVTLLPSLFQGEQKKAVLELRPLRYDARRRQLVLAKRLRVELLFSGHEAGESGRGSQGRAPRSSRTAAAGQLLARLYATSRGLYAAAFEQLFPGQRRGLSASQLRLERQGEAVAFHLEPPTSTFGPGSRLFFHVEQPAASTDYSPELAYELVSAREATPMPLQEATPGGPTLASLSSVARRFETNRFYQPGLLEAPDVWVWDAVASGATRVEAFSLAGVVAGGTAELAVYLQGASESGRPVDHHLSVSLNGVLLGEARFAGRKPYRISQELPPSLLREGANELQLANVPDTGVSSLVFLDRFELRQPQAPSFAGGLFEGTWSESGTAALAGASASAVLLDVTGSPRWLTGFQATGGVLRFGAEAGHRYLAASSEAWLLPRIERPAPSSLRATSNQADYLLIAPRAFLAAAEPLVARRADQGLVARAVAFEEIVSEFGHGQPSAEAIQAFLAYAYQSWARPSPRYVVLLGDSSYDPRNFMGTSPPSPLPALWTKTSYLWTVSDPELAAVNGEDAVPDLAIGRLPATTPAQAETLVAKLLAWEASGQGFAGRVALVADNPDLAGDFEADVEDIASSYFAGRDPRILKLSELGAATRTSIRDALNAGLSHLDYVGHGGAAVWASENVWNSWDASSLQAQSEQPLLVTMNCLNGYFVAPAFESLAESLMKAEGRGVVAAFSPSGLSVNGPAHRYHRALVAALTSGSHTRLGDAILAAQQAYAESGLMPELLSEYHLLGDPAMSLAGDAPR